MITARFIILFILVVVICAIIEELFQRNRSSLETDWPELEPIEEEAPEPAPKQKIERPLPQKRKLRKEQNAKRQKEFRRKRITMSQKQRRKKYGRH